jgi:uncharacterized protein YceK
MEKRTVWMKSVVIFAVLGLTLAGCATMQKSEAMDSEQSLAAAGFKMKPADNPKKLAHLQSLPQRNLFPRQEKGTTYYVYADANYCKCMYVGDYEAYHSYLKSQFTSIDKQADWNLWGPWERGE